MVSSSPASDPDGMAAVQSEPDPRPGLVLVVDDDPKFATIAMRILKRTGYRCVRAESGTEALRAVREHRPDAVVLDVMIPAPDGLDICRQLRSDGWPGGVVMVSARHSPADRATAVGAGADVFLGKPFPLDELVAAVDALVRRP
jgi:two-component system, OmpR family, response regulator